MSLTRTTRLIGFVLAGTFISVASNVLPQAVLAREADAGPSQSSQKLLPQKGNLVLVPSDRLVVGTVEEVTAGQVKVNTGEVMPRYLPLKMAIQCGSFLDTRRKGCSSAWCGSNRHAH